MAVDRVRTIIDQANGLTQDELAQLIRQASEMLEHRRAAAEKVDYVALIGSGKGLYASPEEVVRFIREERDQWER
jgi:hypothetical protein